MPYKLKGNCVVKSDTGETVKCHETRAKALAHLRALEANVSDATEKEITPEQATAIVEGYNALGQTIANAGIPQAAKPSEEEKPAEETQTDEKSPVMSEDDDTEEEQKMMDMPMGGVMRPTQEEVNYISHTEEHGQECEMCRWFLRVNQGGPYCHLIENAPMDILPTGHCDRFEVIPDMEMIEQTPIPVVIVEAEKKAAREHINVAQRIKETARKMMNPVDDKSPFIIYKGADGKSRWFARYTNNFEDLEGDIFTEKAHDRYIARLNAGFIPMPELRFWHLKGTRHGQAEKVMRDGHIVMAWGTFDETPFAEKCLKFYRKNKGKIQLSHGSLVPQWARKQDPETGCRLFIDYNTFEITTLPPTVAKGANPFTTFSEDITMTLKPEQKALLIKEFGEEEATRIERANDEINKTIPAFAQYKDYADLVSKHEEKSVSTTVPTLLGDLYEAQALVLKLAEGVAARQVIVDAEFKALKDSYASDMKAAQDTIAALRKEADQFAAFISLTPRRAATDPATVLTPEQAAEVQKQIPTEVDPYFGDLGIPKQVK